MEILPSTSGIISYATAIPRFRITVEEIARAHGQNAIHIERGLGLKEKTVPAMDQDTITLAVDAAKQACHRTRQHPSPHLDAIYVGSESHPYTVKSSATFIGQAINHTPYWTAADTEFACKAGTAALQMIIGLLESKRIHHGLAVGADTAQGAPGDPLEFSAAAGAAAFLLGREQIIAKLLHTTSYTTDTPDFWRRESQKFPQHGGRFTGDPAYNRHIIGATTKLLQELELSIEDFDHIVFHMPNGKFPRQVAKKLGAKPEQLQNGFIVTQIGNTYSACSLLGLAAVLDKAKPHQKILLTSYGSGAGSDSFAWQVTPHITKWRKANRNDPADLNLKEQLENKHYIQYGQYVKHTGKLAK